MLLSARGMARTISVARTIACLARSDETADRHVSEALQYRVPSDHPAQEDEADAMGRAGVA